MEVSTLSAACAAMSRTQRNLLMKNVSVVSYNVLSPNLGTASSFYQCSKESLNPQKRFNTLLSKLKVHVAQGAVICLQEVTELWAGRLHAWFSKRKYRMISSHYHRPFTGYMGVAIAFSIRFEVQDVQFIRPSTQIETKTSLAENCASPSLPVACETRLDYKLRYTINVAICVKLRVRGSRKKANGSSHYLSPYSFCLVTYHFPCDFRDPEYMTALAGLLVMRSQFLAGDLPLIIAGDFNSTPDTPVFGLVTTGVPLSSDKKVNFTSLRVYGKSLFLGSKTKKIKPMRSVYSAHLGREPDFTNYSRRRVHSGAIHDFCGTIDYIFVSSHWNVVNTIPMISSDDVQRKVASYPCEAEPSDHVMLGAQLAMQQSSPSKSGPSVKAFSRGRPSVAPKESAAQAIRR